MQWVQMGTSRNENASICPKFEWLVHLCLDQYQSINILFLFPSSPVPPSLPLPLPSPAALLPSLSSTPSVGDEYEEYRMWSKNKTKRRGYEQVDDGDGDDGDDDGDMNDGRARRQGAPGKMHSPKTQLIIGYISKYSFLVSHRERVAKLGNEVKQPLCHDSVFVYIFWVSHDRQTEMKK